MQNWEDCHLSGTYAAINNVKKGMPMASAGAGIFRKESSYFAGHSEQLKSAWRNWAVYHSSQRIFPAK